jgi:hypothetical protein
MLMNKLEQSVRKTLRTFINILPIIIGMLLLTSLAITFFPKMISPELFGKYEIIDILLGASIGSVAAGHPIVSYILGGELVNAGVSLFVVTALIVSWVTVGVVQLPAEALLLGKRFALFRNLICFFSAIAISYLTVYTLHMLG